jgi:hypothetical protein
MSTTESSRGTTIDCPWCGEARVGERTVTVGPPPHLGDAHAFELHGDCFEDWRTFVARARRLTSAGGRQTLIVYPLENGVDGLVADER